MMLLPITLMTVRKFGETIAVTCRPIVSRSIGTVTSGT
jgi:hypothetical protein